MKVAVVWIGILALLPAVQACIGDAPGSTIEAGAPETAQVFARASTTQFPAFTIIQYDPSNGGGDEVHFLRFTQTDKPNTLQPGDLNLQTGQIITHQSPERGYSPFTVKGDFAREFDALGYRTPGQTSWYLDVDQSGALSRLDLRLNTVTYEGTTYHAGSLALLADVDLDAWGGAPPDTNVASIDATDLAWRDAGGSKGVSLGDCLLFQPAGFSAKAVAGDIRLSGDVAVNQAPSPSLVSSALEGVVPATINFTLAASDPEGDELRWEFDWDGDGNVDLAGRESLPRSLVHTYQQPGSFTARLYVYDDDSNATAELTVTVRSATQVAPEGGVDQEATPDEPRQPAIPGLGVAWLALVFVIGLRKR